MAYLRIGTFCSLCLSSADHYLCTPCDCVLLVCEWSFEVSEWSSTLSPSKQKNSQICFPPKMPIAVVPSCLLCRRIWRRSEARASSTSPTAAARSAGSASSSATTSSARTLWAPSTSPWVTYPACSTPSAFSPLRPSKKVWAPAYLIEVSGWYPEVVYFLSFFCAVFEGWPNVSWNLASRLWRKYRLK